MAVYGKGSKGAGLALMLSLWNNNLTLCTDGPAELTDEQRSRLNDRTIAVKEARIRGRTGENAGGFSPGYGLSASSRYSVAWSYSAGAGLPLTTSTGTPANAPVRVCSAAALRAPTTS